MRAGAFRWAIGLTAVLAGACAGPAAGQQPLGELAAFSHRDGCAAAVEFASGRPQKRTTVPNCRAMTRQANVSSMVASPDGRRLYVVDADRESVVAYKTLAGGGIRESRGEGSCAALTAARVGCRLAANVEDRHGGAAAISPDGRFLYVATLVGPDFDEPKRPSVVVIDVLRTDGGLARVGCVSSDGSDGRGGAGACAPARGLTTPAKLVVSGDGRSLYAVSSSRVFAPSTVEPDAGVAVFTRDPETGVLAQPDGPAGCATRSGAGGACAAEPAYEGLVDFALAPSGAVAYATVRPQGRSGGVLALRRDASGGALTAASCIGSLPTRPDCAPDADLDSAEVLSSSPDGGRVYVGTDVMMVVLTADEATATLARRGCISDGYPKKCARVLSDPSFGRMVFSNGGRSALLQTAVSIESLDFVPADETHTSRGCISAENEEHPCSAPVVDLAIEDLTVAPSGDVTYAGEGRTIYTLAPGAPTLQRTARLSRRAVPVAVRCEARRTCTGTLSLEFHDEELPVPRASFSIPAGADRTVRIRVSAAFERAIVRRRRVTFEAVTRIALGGRQGLASARTLRVDAAAPGRRPTCRSGGVRTLARTSRVRVYTVRTPGAFDDEVYETTYACLFTVSRPVKLDEPDVLVADAPFVNVGSLLAYDHELAPEGESDAASFVRVVDLRTGRERRSVCAAGPEGCGFESADIDVHTIVMLPSGGVAWTAFSGGDHSVMKADAGAREVRVLDETEGRIKLGSLRLRGNRLTWRHGGSTRSATLR